MQERRSRDQHHETPQGGRWSARREMVDWRIHQGRACGSPTSAAKRLSFAHDRSSQPDRRPTATPAGRRLSRCLRTRDWRGLRALSGFRSRRRRCRHHCRAARVSGLGRDVRRGTREGAESPRRSGRTRSRRTRPTRIARLRQADQARTHARHSARGREPALLRRGDHAMGERRACDRRTHAELHPAPAARRGRLHLAVEPAAVSVHLEDRAGTRGRQYGRCETLGSHAVHGGATRRTCD